MAASPDDRSSLAVTYAAPLFVMSGYATMARAVVLGLDALGVRVTAQPLWGAGVADIRRIASLPDDVTLRPLEYGAVPVHAALRSAPDGEPQTIYLRLGDGHLLEYRSPVDAATVERLLACAASAPRRDGPFVMHMIPAKGDDDFYAIARRLNPEYPYYVGSTMFETAGVPAGWATAANAMDEIWVPSTFNQRTFAASGIFADKLHVLPLGVDARRFDPARVAPLAIDGRKGFTFLSVFQWTRRKGWDVLLRAYLDAFRADDDVTLVLRTYAGSGVSAAPRLRDAIVSLGHDPERCADIVLLDAPIPDALLPALYAACDAYVLPSRGEGWGMPYLEAMAMGKPTIGTRATGNLEFMHDENAFLIDVDGLRPVDDAQLRDDPLYDGQLWAEPSVAHTTELLHRVYEDAGERGRRGARARADVEAQWTVQQQAARIRERLAAIQPICDARRRAAPPPPKPATTPAARDAATARRVSVSGRVHVVLADEGWILEQCGRELERRLPYVHVGSAADQSAAINYYVNYAAWRGRASAIEVALFTHIEERVPEAAARFFAVAHAMTTSICMSRVYAERLRAAGVGDVHEITPGVDLDAYRPIVRIAVVGRTYPTGRKGEALVQAVMDEPGIEWHFTGEGWPGPAERHPPERMPQLYNAVDYVLVPALYEGGPMPLLEALACGKEVIAPPVGFVPDYPHIPYRTGDVADLRRVLRELVARRMALRAAVEHRSWDAWARAHDGLFRRMLCERDKPEGSRPVSLAPSAAGDAPTAIGDHVRGPQTHTASPPRSQPADVGVNGTGSARGASPAHAPLRVLLALHAPESETGGGPSVRVPRLQAELRALGIDADVTTAALPDPRGYTVAHVFNVWDPAAALAQLRHFRACGVPVVFSPIYLDLSELTWAQRAIPAAFRQASSDEELARHLASIADGTLTVDGLRRAERHEIVPGYFAAVREMVALADHLIALSHVEIARLAAAGAHDVPFTLVRNTVDVARFAAATPDAFTSRYGVRDYVLCVGRLEPRKNQLMLAQALRASGVPLVLLGAVADDAYAALVRRHGGANVHLIESLPHDSDLLASAYAGARVFALPSWCEGAPLSALEAAATGTELVLSDRSAEPEYFGPAATYCDPGDMQALGETVLTAYHRPPDEPRRAERRACVAAYTWQDVVCATLEAYRHAIDHARTRLPGATRALTVD
ncbi:MAG: glycosyltransferase [Deltaproteobacteria bacterium]|nr:MAG: glycosyltransferase [Deltaproteobacteria bacterium]